MMIPRGMFKNSRTGDDSDSGSCGSLNTDSSLRLDGNLQATLFGNELAGLDRMLDMSY